MKTIVIPDLHHRIDWVQPFLAETKYDEVVFLGDYFDDFGDNSGIAFKTAKFVLEMLDFPNSHLILGNHDMAYRFFNNQQLTNCSGYTLHKCSVINTILEPQDWDKTVLYYETQGFFLSHAGIRKETFGFSHNKDVKLELIRKTLAKALQDAYNNKYSNILAAGYIRGGFQPFGGITWLDWREFSPITNINQIVGHTPIYNQPKCCKGKNSENWLLDTQNRHIGVITDGVFSFIENKWI